MCSFLFYRNTEFELNSSQTQQIEFVFVHALLHWFFSCILHFSQTQGKLKPIEFVIVPFFFIENWIWAKLKSNSTSWVCLCTCVPALIFSCILNFSQARSKLRAIAFVFVDFFLIEFWIRVPLKSNSNSSQTQQLEFVFVHALLHLFLVVYWILVKLKPNLKTIEFVIVHFLNENWIWAKFKSNQQIEFCLCTCAPALVSSCILIFSQTQVKLKTIESVFVHFLLKTEFELKSSQTQQIVFVFVHALLHCF